MRRLALEYEINKMSILYEEKKALWDNAEFTFNKDFTGHLILWEDNIEPEQISETLKRIQNRAESFRVALKYLGNYSVEIKEGEYPSYSFDERQFTPRTKAEIIAITNYIRGRIVDFGMLCAKLPTLKVSFVASIFPAPLPSNMPSIPPDLQRICEIILAADELSKYPDLVMKLAYLALEELETVPPDELRFSRNFVSHTICKDPAVITFIEFELPSARVTGGVQFRRNDKDHISFVSKYAYPALQRAKELFKEKVRTEGGFL